MLITCPNCKKRFEMDPASVREAKKLRCSSCRAVFRLVRKPQAEVAATPVEQPRAAAAEAPAPAPAAQRPIAAEGDRQLRSQSPSGPAAPQGAAEPARPQAVPGRLKVVIANESVPFCEAVQKVLSTEPFDVILCNDGKVALETVQRLKPEVLLLDVALPTMFGFEVCERVRQDPSLSGVKIVLIAAIYDKTRYKRSPNSLYGADDYIEKHHIPDSLIPMIYRLASVAEPVAETPSEQELAAQEESREEIRQVEVAETSAATALPEELLLSAAAAAAAAAPEALPLSAADAAPELPVMAAAGPPAAAAPPASPAPAQLSEAETKAKRLARIIVSDIVLYNQAKVEQGVREGNFFELLADDIREGERLYKQRVAQEVRDNSSFLKDAFNEVIAKKRAELRI